MKKALAAAAAAATLVTAWNATTPHTVCDDGSVDLVILQDVSSSMGHMMDTMYCNMEQIGSYLNTEFPANRIGLLQFPLTPHIYGTAPCLIMRAALKSRSPQQLRQIYKKIAIHERAPEHTHLINRPTSEQLLHRPLSALMSVPEKQIGWKQQDRLVILITDAAAIEPQNESPCLTFNDRSSSPYAAAAPISCQSLCQPEPDVLGSLLHDENITLGVILPPEDDNTTRIAAQWTAYLNSMYPDRPQKDPLIQHCTHRNCHEAIKNIMTRWKNHRCPTKPPTTSTRHGHRHIRPNHSPTPHKHSWSAHKHSRSAHKHSRTPHKHSRTPHKHSRSPHKHSRSPHKHSRTPHKHSRSAATLEGIRGSELHSVDSVCLSSAIELMIVHDATLGLWEVKQSLISHFAALFDHIAIAHPGSRVGFMSFRDKPVPFRLTESTPSSDDYCAKVHTPLTNDFHHVLQSMKSLECGGGCDTPEAQYIALMGAARDPSIGWNLNKSSAGRYIIMVTDSVPHSEGDLPPVFSSSFREKERNRRRPDHHWAGLARECSEYDYPNPSDLISALRAEQINLGVVLAPPDHQSIVGGSPHFCVLPHTPPDQIPRHVVDNRVVDAYRWLLEALHNNTDSNLMVCEGRFCSNGRDILTHFITDAVLNFCTSQQSDHPHTEELKSTAVAAFESTTMGAASTSTIQVTEPYVSPIATTLPQCEIESDSDGEDSYCNGWETEEEETAAEQRPYDSTGIRRGLIFLGLVGAMGLTAMLSVASRPTLTLRA